MERTEDGRLSAAGRLVVVLRHRQHRQAQHVRQQDELLALIVGDVAAAGQELDALEPLLFGQLHLACKGMQVLHETVHDALEPRVCRLRLPREHGVGDGVMVQIAHDGSPSVQLQLGPLRDRAPLGKVLLAAPLRLLRAVALDTQVHLCQTRLHGRRQERGTHVTLDFLDRGSRQAGRCHQGLEEGGIEPRMSALGDRRNLGE